MTNYQLFKKDSSTWSELQRSTAIMTNQNYFSKVSKRPINYAVFML
jgi:hypothetical protein